MNSQEKREEKRQLLLKRTAETLGTSLQDAERLFGIKRLSSFRINRLKAKDKDTLLSVLNKLGWKGDQSAFYKDGYSIYEGRQQLVDSEAAKDGMIFIQNQASWLPVLALDPQPGETILDMAAAPGGKASHIAELTGNRADLYVNDNSRTRLYKLRANFERLGTVYSRQTMYGIERIGKALPADSFAKILLDAPCSGEGLMNLGMDKDFTYWSVAQIKRLQHFQKKAILSAWNLLRPGGILVYSTCTMAPEENEAVVDYLLRRREDAAVLDLPYVFNNRVHAVADWKGKTFNPEIKRCLRLTPSPLLEAFFVAKLVKNKQ